MADDPVNELVNVVDLFGTAPNYWKLRDEGMAGDGLPKLPEGSPAYEYTGSTVVHGEAEVRQAQREAYEAGRAAGVLDGWKLVPVEPTDEMRTACKVLNYADDIDAEWSRMLAAAPQPPKEKS